MLLCYIMAFSYKLGLIRELKKLHEIVFNLVLKPYKKSFLEQQAKVFWQLYLDELIYAPAHQHLKQSLKNEHYVAIFSSSPEFLVKEVSHHFGVPGYVATEYAVDKNGWLTKIENVIDGNQKALMLNKLCAYYQIPLTQTWAYTDSIDDLPLLQVAANSICVQPDKKLLKKAKQRNWTII